MEITRIKPSAAWGFRDTHTGASILICGCGESLNLLQAPERFITIGVNDVGRRFTPDYLVVVNPRSQFTGDRFRYVEESRAKVLFTQLADLGTKHTNVVRFKLGQYRGTDFSNPEVLHYTKNSPYVALCLAIHMGARRIGLLGVDFTEHHFFGKTGVHPLARQLATIDDEYRRLRAAAEKLGVEIVNLSPHSRLTAFDKMSIDAFAQSSAPPQNTAVAKPDTKALNIVSYSTTPVAGVPAILARCITARTPHTARCVWATNDYGNGVSFDGDLEWRTRPEEAEHALSTADVVIAHNGKIDPRHQRLLAGKHVVTLAHNYMWNVDRRFEHQGMPRLVVGQYQATLPEFAGWTPVPNPIPAWEHSYSPESKPDVVTICYTPSGRHESYPAGHRLYWHGKGYDTTMLVLDRLAQETGARLEVVRNGQFPHSTALAMKRRSHIVIDECVTGSYHRNSLEGLAAGCVVVNGVGLLPGVAEILGQCAPGMNALPFVFASLETLEAVLRGLIERGPDSLAQEGLRNRLWLERFWNFSDQWTEVWAPALTQKARPTSMRVGTAAPPAPARHQVKRLPISTTRNTVSVVVPHAGTERLPHLGATLKALRQCHDVGEIIVAEMGETPVAAAIARQWADKHVFVPHTTAFERARTLNIGSALAEHPLVLWHDNDIITEPGFIAHAVRELTDRRLDYLLPYTSVRYLSEVDSVAIMDGSRKPSDCRPVQVLYSGRVTPRCSGGIGLVTRHFLERYGGFVEGFRGWGGEDNAWNVKVRLLGRTAATSTRDQDVYHLFHSSSAGYSGQATAAANPHYADNVALLQQIQRIRRAEEMLRRFPAPEPPTCKRNADGMFVVEMHDEPHRNVIVSQPVQPEAGLARAGILTNNMPQFRNVFACLVHENQECVVDLVRNLRYMDPASTILLYNGGRDPSLLSRGFPFEKYGAVVHPRPRPLSWGRLHEFAIDCMQYAIDSLQFDAITIVDSDQLAARPGYSEFIGRYFKSNPRAGLLGSSAAVQPRNTRVPPVLTAFRETELWQPFLARFDGGPGHFGRWTFWPSTAFSAAAAHDLTRLFASDEQLAHILERTQICATEEVILPMLVGLLGHEIVESPCSYEYVKYRVAYNTRDIAGALTRPNVFWIHPVNRRYDDPIRKHVRDRFNHYERPFRSGGIMARPPISVPRPLFLTTPVLNRMRSIEGWLEDDEADLLIALTARALEELPAPHAIVEVGSYCGRSTVVFGAVVQAHRPDARVYAIDPHDGVVGALDQGVQSGPSTLARFQKNIADAGLQSVVVTVQQCSYETAWTQPVSVLFIDGLHDYGNVSRDFHHFERYIVAGGYVAFHDFASYYPGVKAFVNELLASGDYEQVTCVRTMMLLRKRGSAAVAEETPATNGVMLTAEALPRTEEQRAMNP